MTLDALVVLGGGILRDGSLPPNPMKRVELAVKLHQKGIATRIIMATKYSYTLGFVPPKTEAQAMADYAKQLGFSEALLEESSTETVGNALYTKIKYLEPNGWKNIGIVTSKFHMPRGKYIFDMVLGDSYNIEYFEAQNDLPEGELKIREQVESALLWNLKFRKLLHSDHERLLKEMSEWSLAYSDGLFHKMVRGAKDLPQRI